MADAPDILTLHAQVSPEHPAIVEGDRTIRFDELNRLTNRLTNGLRALGVAPGERAVWCGANSHEVLVFIHAARKLGLVAIPLSYRFTPEEMHYVIDNSEASVVVVDAEQAPEIAKIRDRLPSLRHVVVYRGDAPGTKGATGWDEVVAAGTDDEPSGGGVVGKTMIYTSGTTGKPKGAMRSGSDQALVMALVQELRMGPGEIHLAGGPLYHSGPNAFAFLSTALGGTVVLLRKFDAAEFVGLVRVHRITSSFLAPTQLKRIVTLPADVLREADFSSMRTLIANAAPVPYALKEEVVAKLGDGFLFEVYGSTELGVDTVLAPEDQLRKPGSCGRPYGGIELKVVDDDGNVQPTGQPGELFVRTALAMDGYHETAEQLDELGGGWKSVGDVAYLDDEGFVYICDRKKDMIISGGMNIYPAEIEAVLHAHPDVMDVAVFGVPDEDWGESVHAVVQPKVGHTVDLDALAAFAREHLAGFKIPRSWEQRDALPRTESGKLLKRVLRDEHWGRGKAL